MPTDEDDWLPRKKPSSIFFCPCWGSSISNKSRHVRFAEPITMPEDDDSDMIPSADDDDDDNEAEFFQESFQTNAELLVASSEHDSMFDRILGPFRAKSSSQKQILVLEQIIRLFLFVILLRWKEEPERLSQPSNETTCSTKDPGRHTTTTTKTSTPSTL